MRRILYDVPRWSIFVHRQARGMPRVDHDDTPVVQFQDELFEKLYTGEAELLGEATDAPGIARWAQAIHEQCDALPSFGRFAADCRGDSDAAAVGVDELMAELAPRFNRQAASPEDDAGLRRVLRTACSRATDVVGELREVMQGLEHVAFSEGVPNEATRGLARRLRGDERLRRIALLAGRFKRIAGTKRRQRVHHGAEELVDVEQGGNLERLLPSELAKLAHPRLRLLTLADILEGKALQYRLEGKEALGKGPLIVALDKSGSMGEDARDIWATAVALALLDHAKHERRPFALLAFDGGIKFEALVTPGESLPEAGLFVPCSGGTDIQRVLTRGLDIVEGQSGALRQADLVLITDGASDAEHAPALRVRAVKLGTSILGFGIGVEASALHPWCDEIECVTDLSTIDDATADKLFSR